MLKSLSNLPEINLGPLFNKAMSTEEGRGYSSQLYGIMDSLPTSYSKQAVRRGVFSKSTSETAASQTNPYTISNMGGFNPIANPFNFEGSVADDFVDFNVESSRQTKILSEMLDTQKDQTGYLKDNLKYLTGGKVEDVQERKDKEFSAGLFKSLEDTITSSQRTSTSEINENLDSLRDNLIEAMALTSRGSYDSDGSLDDMYDDVDRGKGKKKKKSGKGKKTARPKRPSKAPRPPKGPVPKRNIFSRILSKGRGALGKVASMAPGAIGTTLSLPAGTALSGAAGAGTAIAAGAGVIGAGALGYGAGTLINKGMTIATGKEDWLTSWFSDRRDAKAQEERRKEDYKRFRQTHSEDTMNLAGGRENFDPSILVTLRKRGLISKKGKFWFTQKEIDEQVFKDLKTAIEKSSETTPPDVMAERSKVIRDLESKKEKLLVEKPSREFLETLAPERDVGRVKKLMASYEELTESIKTASYGEKKVFEKELSQVQAILKEITTMNYEELTETYRQKVVAQIRKEMEAIAPEVAKVNESRMQLSEAETAEFINNKRDEVITQIREDRVKALDDEVKSLEAQKKEAESYGEVRVINKKIKDLEEKRADLEKMTAAEYRKWLEAAIMASMERIKSLESKRNSIFSTLGPEATDKSIYNESKMLGLYESEQKRIDNVTRSAASALPQNAPAPVPTSVVTETQKEQKAKAKDTRDILDGKKSKPPVVTVNVPPVVPPPQAAIRASRTEDVELDLIRNSALQ